MGSAHSGYHRKSNIRSQAASYPPHTAACHKHACLSGTSPPTLCLASYALSSSLFFCACLLTSAASPSPLAAFHGSCLPAFHCEEGQSLLPSQHLLYLKHAAWLHMPPHLSLKSLFSPCLCTPMDMGRDRQTWANMPHTWKTRGARGLLPPPRARRLLYLLCLFCSPPSASSLLITLRLARRNWLLTYPPSACAHRTAAPLRTRAQTSLLPARGRRRGQPHHHLLLCLPRLRVLLRLRCRWRNSA